jgi:hypothetical protein
MEVVVVGSSAALDRIRDGLGAGALSSFEVHWRSSTRIDLGQAAPGVSVRCWIDLGNPHRARVYFSDALAERFVVRTVPLSGRLDETDREVLSQVVELSVHALEEDLRAGVTREEAFPPPSTVPTPPAPPPPVSRPPPDSSHLVLRPGSFYSVSAHSDQVLVTHGPGLLLALLWSGPHAALAIGLRGRYELPQTYRDPRVGLRFATLAWRAEAEYLVKLGGGFLGVRLGGGSDLVWLWPRTSGTSDEFESAGDRQQGVVVCSGGVVAGISVSPGVSLVLEVAAEVDPTTVHYDVDLGTDLDPVITRYRVRPVGMAGVRLW